jgi:hypothetical protein
MELFNEQEYARWIALPEKKKRKVLNKSFRLILDIADREESEIKAWEKQSDEEKKVGHVYVAATVQIFWDNVRLMMHLGEDRFANFAFYPARTCMETFLQFFYFCKQDQGKKDEIAVKELLRSALKYYQAEKAAGGTGDQYADFYKFHTTLVSVPPIEKVKDDDLRLFPGIRKLCDEYSTSQAKSLYSIYQYLCEDVHGRILSNVIRRQSEEAENYRRSLIIIFSFCKDMLLLVDRDYLGTRFRKEVEAVIPTVDAMLKKSIAKRRFFSFG